MVYEKMDQTMIDIRTKTNNTPIYHEKSHCCDQNDSIRARLATKSGWYSMEIWECFLGYYHSKYIISFHYERTFLHQLACEKRNESIQFITKCPDHGQIEGWKEMKFDGQNEGLYERMVRFEKRFDKDIDLVWSIESIGLDGYVCYFIDIWSNYPMSSLWSIFTLGFPDGVFLILVSIKSSHCQDYEETNCKTIDEITMDHG